VHSGARTGVRASASCLIFLVEASHSARHNLTKGHIMRIMAMTHATASRLFAHDAARWASVIRRDQHTDGLFYDAVQTRRVYCRPPCPARLVGGRETLNHG
jgi:metal binding Ada-like protein